MRFLSHLLFQIDEARRYIEDGRLEPLRLAVLLLDNAAEIQMDRRIKDDLRHDDMMERVRNNILPFATSDDIPGELRELIAWTPLTRSEKSRLDHFFDEKVDYMVGRGGHIEKCLTEPLKHLHRYRNEAYHRAKTRPETIRTASLILLEINCQMMLSIPPGSRSFSLSGDYSWIAERFHLGSRPFDFDLTTVVDEIRFGLLPGDQAVAIALADHLQDRFLNLDGALKFVAENSCVKDKEEALRISQYYAEIDRTKKQPTELEKRNFTPKYYLHSIQELETQVPLVRSAADRLTAFSSFSATERKLEPIEECVNEMVLAIDSAIELQSEIARGK
ncbi:MAG: hypothetical protein WB341_02040 [Terracidiphilus sp.]